MPTKMQANFTLYKSLLGGEYFYQTILYLPMCVVIRVDVVIIFLVFKILFVTKFTVEHLFQIP